MTDVDFKMEVLEKFGVLSQSATGWTKEFRLMSWNGCSPRYDLREWAPGDRRMSRGITLSAKEIRELQELLMEMEFPEQDETDADGEIASEAKDGGAKRKAS